MDKPSQKKRRRNPEETREDLVQATVRLILRQGFSATRVDEICAEAGVTKGAFFHHFKGKEEVGEAAIEWWGRMGGGMYEPAWTDDGRDPLERLRQMLEIMAGFTERPEACVCVVGMMSQEFAQSNESFRQAADRELVSWNDQVTKLLADAKAAHPGAVEFDPEQVAWFLNSLWQGSMLVSKTHGDPEMIRANLRIARDYVDGLFLPESHNLTLKS
ncbi:TetR/AcrR family transcriptional regulator [Haloferula sargassicola]|uniref:Transcriptional regulator AcuR n=1 Tax=Haloferula sargassicola TaxID=490096 RepID=A0ABP9UPV3_9BACT